MVISDIERNVLISKSETIIDYIFIIKETIVFRKIQVSNWEENDEKFMIKRIYRHKFRINKDLEI
jgi:hypothetical protein